MTAASRRGHLDEHERLTGDSRRLARGRWHASDTLDVAQRRHRRRRRSTRTATDGWRAGTRRRRHARRAARVLPRQPPACDLGELGRRRRADGAVRGCVDEATAVRRLPRRSTASLERRRGARLLESTPGAFIDWARRSSTPPVEAHADEGAPDRDAAFTDFVAARQTHLRRIAYALCGDWHHADDLLQTALAKLYVAWPRIRQQGSEEAYCGQIMVRANIDESRRPWRRERPSDDLPDRRRTRADTGRGALGALRRAAGRCPSSSARWSCCGTGSGSRCGRPADELGISEGTVKSHSSRGLAALEAVLAPHR